jgi:hypothetical protein
MSSWSRGAASAARSLRMKAAAGRPQDEIDITSLERARRPGQA